MAPMKLPTSEYPFMCPTNLEILTETFSVAQVTAVSPNGVLVAIFQPTRLVIRQASTNAVLHAFNLPTSFRSNKVSLKWYLHEKALPSNPTTRVLVADENTVHIFCPDAPTYKATINHGLSGCADVLKISDVNFGHTPDEVFVFTDFGLKLTIWSLLTNHGVEVRDPKQAVRANGNGSTGQVGQCYAIRRKGGQLAILTRPAAQDVLLILEPSEEGYRIAASVELGTIDAQQVTWSPDGCWIAVRDTPCEGHKVLLLTADGQLFKIWHGRDREENDIELGVRILQWGNAAGKEVLAIGDANDEIALLGGLSVSSTRPRVKYKTDLKQLVPLGMMRHYPTELRGCFRIWEEQIDELKGRNYNAAPKSVILPTSGQSVKDTVPRRGVSIILFSPDGLLLASKTETYPTTIWIWSMQTGGLVSILIHHSPVKNLEWHKSHTNLLLIHCMIQDPTVHLWRQSWLKPITLSVPLRGPKNAKIDAAWLQVPDDAASKHARVLLPSAQAHSTADFRVPDGLPVESPTSSFTAPFMEMDAAPMSVGTGPEDMFDEGNSLDLSPIKLSHRLYNYQDPQEYFGDEANIDSTTDANALDDTFYFQKRSAPPEGVV